VKYTIDTNLYIEAIKTPVAEMALSAFLEQFGPLTYLNGVVMQELRSGARTPPQVNALETEIFARFERVDRCFGPSVAAFKDCGRVLVALWRTDGVPFMHRPRSLVNDILIAVSCREYGVTLITGDKDYDRLVPHIKGFRHVSPWP
jgi:predicted nucleic acid-binding protein